MDYKKTLLVVNPVSGTGSKAGIIDTLRKPLQDSGFYVQVALTERAGHGAQLAAEAVEQGFGSVIVCGGDGTVNEAASVLCGTGVALGIIPSGSGNGLARHLGIPIDESKSLDIIRMGHIEKCDAGEVTGSTIYDTLETKKFFCTCGVGFDALVSRRFAQDSHRGKITYIKKIFEELAHYKPRVYRLGFNGETIETEAFVVACCNASQYGNNAFIAPQASVTDGYLDLVVMKNRNALQTLVAGFDVLTGMVPYNKDIESYRVKECVVDIVGPTWAHVDGEPVPCGGHVEVKCLPGELLVFTPPLQQIVTPFLTPIDMSMRDLGIAIEKLFRKPK